MEEIKKIIQYPFDVKHTLFDNLSVVKRCGVTKREFAKNIGISAQYLYRIEKSDISIESIAKYVRRIKEVYKKEIDFINLYKLSYSIEYNKKFYVNIDNIRRYLGIDIATICGQFNISIKTYYGELETYQIENGLYMYKRNIQFLNYLIDNKNEEVDKIIKIFKRLDLYSAYKQKMFTELCKAKENDLQICVDFLVKEFTH